MRFFAIILTVIVLATVSSIGVAQEVDSLSLKPFTMPPDSTILRPFGGLVLSSDSLQRWQQWSGFGEWVSRQPRIKSRDLGGYGRNAGISTSPNSVNSDRIRWNGVIINNPFTGQFNPSEIPFDQSSEVVHHDKGLSEFGVNPQIYSVLKPLTVIHYEQSSYEYRNLDGVLAMPATEKLTIQASFQGQKDDGKFVRSNFAGRRSTGNIRYDMDGKWTTDAFWLYQGAEMQESMGYQFSDPAVFGFDRFRALSRSSNTASMRRFFLFGVKVSPNGSAEDRGITLYRKLHRNEWRTTDTTAIRAQEWGLNATYDISVGSQARLLPYVDASLVSNNLGDVESPSRTTDLMYNLGIRGEYNAGKLADLILHGETSGTLAGTGGLLDVAGRFHVPFNTDVMVGYSKVSAFQPISHDFASNFDYALNELSSKMDVSILYANILRSTGTWRYRFDYRFTNSGSIPAVRSGNEIVWLSLRESAVISGSLERHTDHTEVMIGFNSTSWDFTDGVLGPLSEQRLISSAYWKGYAFKRAAYLKGGAVFSAALSEARSMAYLSELGMWIFNADGAAVPAHHRLDFEFAARVRSMILTGRLENTLDGWTQKGYFQTLPYPMPGRRFRVGLKVHFRD